MFSSSRNRSASLLDETPARNRTRSGSREADDANRETIPTDLVTPPNGLSRLPHLALRSVSQFIGSSVIAEICLRDRFHGTICRGSQSARAFRELLRDIDFGTQVVTLDTWEDFMHFLDTFGIEALDALKQAIASKENTLVTYERLKYWLLFALFDAVSKGDAERVRVFLRQDPETRYGSPNLYLLLSHAVEAQSADIVTMLLAKYGPLEPEKATHSKTLAAKHGLSSILRELVRAKAPQTW